MAIKKVYNMVNMNGETVATGLEGKARVFYWAQRSACFVVADKAQGQAKGTPVETTVYPVEV